MGPIQDGRNREIEPVTHMPSESMRFARKESAMKMRPQSSVLRKIAARRGRVGEPQPRFTWAAVLATRSSDTARNGQIAGDLSSHQLTPREIEVLHLVANGETDQQIADSLYVSRRTINSHVSNILAKLDSANRRQAVI